MSEFTFLFRGREQFASPEQAQKNMERWVAWFKRLRENGQLADQGHPLDPSGRVIQGKQKLVKDGPYAEAKDVVGGYILIEARDIDHAAELARDCPILDVNGSVEIRPVQKLGG